MNNDALTQFICDRQKTLLLLKQLAALTEDYLAFSPDEIEWGHVEEMKRLLSYVYQAADDAGIDPEEALAAS